MEINSGVKVFDKQANDPIHGGVGSGNVSSNVQESQIIRAFCETEANGLQFQEGELQASDLQRFAKKVPAVVLAAVRDLAKSSRVTLYCWWHWRGEKCIRDGYAVTDGQGTALFGGAFVAAPVTWRKEHVTEACLNAVLADERRVAAIYRG